MVKVEIDSIRVSLMSQDRVVVLKDKETERYLPIWIGPFEAEAIRIELQGAEVSRPLTHDLLKSVITQLGASVESVVVSDLQNDVFYAKLNLQVDGRSVEIDSRPSDAIALAVRFRIPIYVEESVIDKAAIKPEKDITPEVTSELEDEVSDATLELTEGEDLGVFEDFLSTLDLDDLDEGE